MKKGGFKTALIKKWEIKTMYNLHYILKDHLGSWTTVTDAEGNVEQELSFDAWGTLRDPETWHGFSQAEPVEAPMFDRGFTGHEHLRFFDLINMNGRMYDPVMSTFLSVDAYVQDPTSAQGFNRYAYCAYNPLRYTDPTGWYMGGGDGNGPDDYPPFAGYVLPEVTVVADAIDTGGTTGGGDTPQGNSGGSGYYPYTPTVPNVPDGYSGTPASQSGPSFNPSINNGGNGNGVHGTGGKPQGNSVRNVIRKNISAVNYTTSSAGLISGSLKWDFDNTKNKKVVDEMCQNLRSKGLAPKNLSGVKIGKDAVSTLGKTSDVLGWAGLGLCGVDIAISGEISPSDIYNAGGSIICLGLGYLFVSSPVGWIAGGVFLASDYISWRWTGKTIGEHLDNAIDWRYKF